MSIGQELKQVRNKVKDEFFRARSHYIKYYEKLPIDDKCILMESQHGANLNGNIFYLAKYLSKNPEYRDYRIFLTATGKKMSDFSQMLQEYGMTDIQVVMLAGEEYFRILATAKYLFNDTSFTPNFIKKKGQVYFNTWHGTPLKTLGRQVNNDFHNMGNVQKNFVCADYLLVPNKLTESCFVNDYMLSDIASTKLVHGGYPRNEPFFQMETGQKLRETLGLEDKRVYAYMPTYRGTPNKSYTDKNSVYTYYYLYELDRKLHDNEVMYVNLHPLVQQDINFNEFKNLRPFPQHVETYEFLGVADCLITDYSSVFFDFVNTRKKIVLFAYDQEEYLRDRGMYLDMAHDLPFPIVCDVPSLLTELRDGIRYDDSEFLRLYAPYENGEAAKKLCDYVILSRDTGLNIQAAPSNGKENVVIYAGNMAGNGITTSLRNLLNTIDLEKRNYYITFKSEVVADNKDQIRTIPEQVRYFPIKGDMNVTVVDRIIRRLFKKGCIKAPLYMKLMSKRIQQDWLRCFGGAKFDTAIQFNGYENEVILMWSQFAGNKIIFVHSDMVQEIATKKNQRKDGLAYAYGHFDHVAAVTTDILESTRSFCKNDQNITVCHNAIDAHSVAKKSKLQLEFAEGTEITCTQEELEAVLDSPKKKYVSIGRFSPEKAQQRLVRAFARLIQKEPNIHLFIVGGVKNGTSYEELKVAIAQLGVEDRVTLIYNLPNPFPLVRQCDYFVLSSLYEGFGLVLAEADICGIPVISTDINGPRAFLQEHGGTLVDNSEDGLYQGMCALLDGKIKPMNVDYEAYNRKVVEEFEAIM